MMNRSVLATRFTRDTRAFRTGAALTEDEMRAVAPSVFAEAAHESRSARYTYIPTIEVLRGLRKEDFEPFEVAQGRSRVEGKAEYTKHMLRLRHAGQLATAEEANEVILINSHDGTSAYQMLAGVFRFVCCNGMVVGKVLDDVRVPHKGDITGEVIDGACRILEDFQQVDQAKDHMKALSLSTEEQTILANAALTVRFDAGTDAHGVAIPPPVTAAQILQPRRSEDVGNSLWATFQRVQENTERGGLEGRSVKGRRRTTRAVQSIDGRVGLNRALWMLAEEMRRLKA